jgi:ribonuclease HI
MSDRINWQRMRFKKNKVWVAVDDEEKPIVKNGKYLIKYQLGQDYEYWVHRNSVRPIDKPQTDSQTPPSAWPPKKELPSTESLSDTRETIDQDTVCIYTDGASSGNPGPSEYCCVSEATKRRYLILSAIRPITSQSWKP